MTKIAPSVLGADFWCLNEQVPMVENAGAEYLHLDIMDGTFVPNISFGPALIKALRPHSKMLFDTHLMVEEPGRFITDYVACGSDLLTVHFEACTHLHRTVQMIKAAGLKAGVALNPSTTISQLEEILPDLDMVLLMSVNPGFCGQKFIPGTLEKIRRLRKMIDDRGLSVDIEVDGGISMNNAADIVKAGADILVSGASLFNAPDLKAAVQDLKNAASVSL